MRAALVAFALLGFTATAAAGEVSATRAAYDAGNFAEAVKLGEAEGSAEGLTIAAQSLLAQRVAMPKASAAGDALVDKAIANTKAAIAKDPNAVEARVQATFAYGLKTRRMSTMEALRSGYGETSKKLINDAIKIRPNDGWAHAMRGGWHLELVRRAGGATASMLGGSTTEGIKEFEKARTLDPNNPALALIFGATLLELDAKKYEAKAKGQLEAASKITPRDAFETMNRDEAKRLLGILASQGAKATAAAVSAKY